MARRARDAGGGPPARDHDRRRPLSTPEPVRKAGADGAAGAAAVVVTGASSGIGEACARRLARLGFRTYAGVRMHADEERLGAAGDPNLVPLRLDVTDPDSISAAAQRVARELGEGRMVGLVNNAGIGVGGPLEFVPPAELRHQFEVNVIGQIAVTQAFLPLLRAGRGRIVNMSSASGRFTNPFMGPYSASKFALEALSDALRLELRPWNIRVAVVQPGVIETPIWRKSLATADRLVQEMPPEAHQLYGGAIGAIRGTLTAMRGIPADRVADAVVHALTSRRPRLRYVVGADARVRVALSYLPTRARDWLVARRLRRLGRGTSQGRGAHGTTAGKAPTSRP